MRLFEVPEPFSDAVALRGRVLPVKSTTVSPLALAARRAADTESPWA